MDAKLTRRALLSGAAGLGLAGFTDPSRAQPDPSLVAPASFLTVDVHCHIFNVMDLPVDGFAVALAHGEGLPNQLDSVPGSLTGWLHGRLNDVASARARSPLLRCTPSVTSRCS